MKEFVVNVKGLEIKVFQKDDGKFIIPNFVKELEKQGTCLKPSYEPIIVARKPCEGSCVDNVLKYGVGGINIDECRVETNEDIKEHSTNQGRFPSNVILTYDETDEQEVCGGMPLSSSNGGSATMPKMGGGELGICNYQTIGADRVETDYIAPCDSGSAARYFYCAKASKFDRDEGFDAFEEQQKYYCDGRPNSLEIFESTDGGRKPLKNIHPTVKPTELMRYIVKLVTPNGGTILDPFNGSGSTGKAVMLENVYHDKQYKYIGIELTEQYLPIAKARIEYAENIESITVSVIDEETKEETKQTLNFSLF